MNTPRPPKQFRVIDSQPRGLIEYIREMIEFREVAYVLIGRDMIVRFRQTYFGLAWLLFKPLMLMVSMTFAFGFVAGFEKANSTPYPLVIFCGVIPWYFFSNAIPDSTGTLKWHLHILQKTYFPRAIFPISIIATDGIEFLVAWLLFAAACIWFLYLPDWRIVFFPVFAAQLIVLCVGLGLLLSVLSVRFRDIANLIPFLLTIGFLLSPIGYTLERIPHEWQLIYALNPLVGIIEGMRWSLLKGSWGFPQNAILISMITTAVIGILGVRLFLTDEPNLVDLA